MSPPPLLSGAWEDLAFPPFAKGELGGFVVSPFAKGGARWDFAFPPFTKGGLGGFVYKSSNMLSRTSFVDLKTSRSENLRTLMPILFMNSSLILSFSAPSP